MAPIRAWAVLHLGALGVQGGGRSPCVLTAWPTFVPERDASMAALMPRINSCPESKVLPAVRLAELEWHREEGFVAVNGSKVIGPTLGGIYTKRYLRANLANAITHYSLMRAVADDEGISDDRWVVFFENDAALHPLADALPAREVARVVDFATRVAAHHAAPMVVLNVSPNHGNKSGDLLCRPVDSLGGLPSRWPTLSFCEGDARSSVAYALRKRYAKEVVAAWEVLREGKARRCSKIWGGRHCPNDPHQFTLYLDTCERLPYTCRAVYVGVDWLPPTSSGNFAGRGLFVQNRQHTSTIWGSEAIIGPWQGHGAQRSHGAEEAAAAGRMSDSARGPKGR